MTPCYRKARKGLSLPLVLGLVVVIFALFLILQANLRQARYRLALQKHRAAAHWLAVSGADVAEARLAKGVLRAGDRLSSPQLQNGRFVVVSRREGGQLVLICTGYSAGEKSVVERRVAVP